VVGTSLLWRSTVSFTYLKVKSAKCLCLLPVVLVILSWSCKQRSWSWSYYFGLGLKNLVLFASLAFIIFVFALLLLLLVYFDYLLDELQYLKSESIINYIKMYKQHYRYVTMTSRDVILKWLSENDRSDHLFKSIGKNVSVYDSCSETLWTEIQKL